MKQTSPKPPQYLRHKSKNLAYVYVRDDAGRRRQIYLGTYGSPASHRQYREVVGQFFCADSPSVPADDDRPGTITISELAAQFLHHAEVYYRKPDGTPTGELENLVLALRPLLKLYRDEVVGEFGPLKLKRVRDEMVDKGLARTTTNYRIGKIRGLFRWGTENELVPVAIYQALLAVKGLKRGRSKARETTRVRPVSERDFRAVLPFLNRHIRAVALLQWYTGARSGELLSMTTDAIDRSGKVWIYEPHRHKTQHHDRRRVIALGPRCREILSSFLRVDGGYLFQPREAELERRALQRKSRRNPVQPSQRERASRVRENPKRNFRDIYSVGNYRQHVARACIKAGIAAPWSPHRLRHSAATRIRKEIGLDASRAVLGHSTSSVTEIYAERDLSIICDAIEKLG